MESRPIAEGGEQEFLRRYVELQALEEPPGVRVDFGYLRRSPPEDEAWDEWVIERGITAALREGRSIDDRTALYIAKLLHEGEDSALHRLAATGEIDEAGIEQELRSRTSGRLPPHVRAWARWLSGYCALRSHTGPVDGWNEQATLQERMDSETVRRNQAIVSLDNLFGEQADEEIGSVDAAYWYGLVRHDRRPGGLILTQDEQGFRHVWETDSDEQLQQHWLDIDDGYERYISDPDRFDALDARLNPLPDLLDIPEPLHSDVAESGYEWMERLPPGWRAVARWGRDGWDLGAWPIAVVALFVDERYDRYAIATYHEGTVTRQRFGSMAALYRAVDDVAEYYWRRGVLSAPDNLPKGSGLLPEQRGPYLPARQGQAEGGESKEM